MTFEQKDTMERLERGCAIVRLAIDHIGMPNEHTLYLKMALECAFQQLDDALSDLSGDFNRTATHDYDAELTRARERLERVA